VAALGFGIVALALTWVPLINAIAVVSALTGIIAAVLCLRGTARRVDRCLALAGIATSLLGLLIAAAVYVVLPDVVEQPQFQERVRAIIEGS
jgi:O-antigen/teichoic acid export membrane protein